MTSIATCAVAEQTVATPVPARRASEVSWMQRAVNTVFGAPSARRANGGAEASFVPRVLRGPQWRRRQETTSVFAVDRKGPEAAERLPRIWITERAQGGDGCGRAFVASYPSGPDKGGWRAFDLAEIYFAEALSLAGEEHRAQRVECYRAAEILLLHAASRGHVAAHWRLGIIYEGDLGEGRYWEGLLESRALHSAKTPCDERAWRHFSYAAYHGHGEACWRLGDMVAAGRGCVADVGRAWQLYRRAFELENGAFDEDRASTGNAALRLARAFELGRGCAQSFRRARTWYRVAACSLGAAFDQGQWHYKRERAEARRGVARMAQELDGRY
ncbi:hypothetical protein PZH32_08850 [Adlercreutzia equolifaciens]|uniref:tetratricopeptide repeat protein n=1 Tax=Adlercreutzia equolifaciens TaxID=446660 RepID=UPI0023B01C50|nr:hypothetical protein [Adlercreutzia equolifaciens]MDE8703066.1 hypothetical protein [Adlercreutzia equolifaciens]